MQPTRPFRPDERLRVWLWVISYFEEPQDKVDGDDVEEFHRQEVQDQLYERNDVLDGVVCTSHHLNHHDHQGQYVLFYLLHLCHQVLYVTHKSFLACTHELLYSSHLPSSICYIPFQYYLGHVSLTIPQVTWKLSYSLW